jgi:hypothetical protein
MAGEHTASAQKAKIKSPKQYNVRSLTAKNSGLPFLKIAF